MMSLASHERLVSVDSKLIPFLFYFICVFRVFRHLQQPRRSEGIANWQVSGNSCRLLGRSETDDPKIGYHSLTSALRYQYLSRLLEENIRLLEMCWPFQVLSLLHICHWACKNTSITGVQGIHVGVVIWPCLWKYFKAVKENMKFPGGWICCSCAASL